MKTFEVKEHYGKYFLVIREGNRNSPFYALFVISEKELKALCNAANKPVKQKPESKT